jgi:hypothetical protein
VLAKDVELKLADEVFLAVALLHREHPRRSDFTLSEIVERVARENLTGEPRPGIRTHASLHCVANRAPNPANYRMLYATGKRTRRLLQPGDVVHPDRRGKIFPEPGGVPRDYLPVLRWAKRRFGAREPLTERWLGGVLQLAGAGKRFWRGQDPDDYVRQLREGWE